MESSLQVAEEEVVVAAEPCVPSSKFEDIYRLLAEGCFPPSFCSIKRKNLKRYAQKFVVDGGNRGTLGGLRGGSAEGTRRCRAVIPASLWGRNVGIWGAVWVLGPSVGGGPSA